MKRVAALIAGLLLLFPAGYLGLRTISYEKGGTTYVCESAARLAVEGFHSHGGEITDAERAVGDAAANHECRPKAFVSVGLGAAVGLAGVGLIGFGAWPRRRSAGDPARIRTETPRR